MRRLVALVALALAVGWAAGGQAAEEPRSVHVVVHDDAAPCMSEGAPCFEIVDDAWGLVSAGQRLHVVFENNASQAHALNIAAGDNASEQRTTNRSAAFAQLGPIEPGERTEATIEIPRGTDTAYLFCHVGDHEAEGLHLLRNVYPAGSVEEARKSGPGLDDPDETPAPFALALVAAAALAWCKRRSRAR